MSKVDDELTRRFHGAERPVGWDRLFEGLARRRRRRRTLQRVQAGALAVAVLAATAGGFVALQDVFREDGRNVGDASALTGDGQIVFVRDVDGRSEIFAAQPDGAGVRRLIDTELNAWDPAVSSDGTMVAYVLQTRGAGGATIATVPIEGGSPTWQTAEHRSVSDPVWSPDGSRIAFLSFTTDTSDLYIAEVGTDVAERIELSREVTSSMATDGLDTLEHPSWSPDGSRIALAVRTKRGNVDASWDIATIRPDGTGFEYVVATGGRDETVPAWSPDGTRIAFLQRPAGSAEPAEVGTVEGDEVWTVAADGSDARLIAVAVDALLRLGLAWAPGGTALLVSDGDHIYRVDATPEGDPRENFVQLMRGFSPSWQPVPLGWEPTPTISPEPSVSPEPEPEGKDVGLGFNLCDSQRLGGIDFLGNGTNGHAWVGVPSKDDGTCPKFYGAAAYVVAADADGNGEAETWSDLPWRCDVMCVAHDATDLDGNGTEELIVASYFSIMDYYVMRYLGPPDEPSPVIVPILVAEPGHEPVGLLPGEPLRIDAGGDAGYGSQIECEGYPEASILVWSWSSSLVDSGDPREVHITRIQLQADGRFHVIGTNDYTVPVDQPSGIERSEAPACGVDFHPNA